MASKGKAGPNVDLYKTLFKEADANGDGYLSISEFRQMLNNANCKMTDGQIADSFVFFDGPRGDRRITFEEFCNGLDKILEFVAKLTQLFEELDVSGDGMLDKAELRQLLTRSGRDFSDADVDTILKEADTNGDNQISLKEFLAACT
nr:calmodulin-A-like protein [Crepidula fornicata]